MSSSQMVNVVSHGSIRLRAEVVEEASERLQRLPNSALRDVADSSYTGIVIVRNGKKHRLRVHVQRNRASSKGVQVTVTSIGWTVVMVVVPVMDRALLACP